jgi:hypothetical protein
VKSVALAVATHPELTPRPSVTVTAPSATSVSDWAAELAVTDPRFTEAGTAMSNVPPVTWNVAVLGAAEAGPAKASTPAAQTSNGRIAKLLRIVFTPYRSFEAKGSSDGYRR